MKRYKDLKEEILTEGGYRYPGDDMTMKELKIAINAAKNILDMLEDGASIQRWQISAIVVASDELASVCTSMRADHDEEMEDEYENEVVAYEYPWMGEEVELDEISDKKLDAYRQKAFADQPAGDDGSDKYRKRKFGRDLAFAKQVGRAKVRATKEEVELDEANKNIIPDEKLNKLIKSKTAVYWNDKGFDKLPNDKFFYIPILDKNKKMLGVYKANANDSDQEYEYLNSILKNLREEMDFKVSVEGLPDMYVKAKNPTEVKQSLRKIVKKPDMIQSVDRVTQSMLKKIFRDKAAGKEEMEEASDVDESSFVAKAAHAKVAGKKSFKLKGSDKEHPVTIKHDAAKKIKKAVSEEIELDEASHYIKKVHTSKGPEWAVIPKGKVAPVEVFKSEEEAKKYIREKG